MATSDSDDFESADEELVAQETHSRKLSSHQQWQNPTTTIDSESDDDNEYMPAATASTAWNLGNRSVQSSGQERRVRSTDSDNRTKLTSDVNKTADIKKEEKFDAKEKMSEDEVLKTVDKICTKEETKSPGLEKSDESIEKLSVSAENLDDRVGEKKAEDSGDGSSSVANSSIRERVQRPRKSKEAKCLGAKKLGSKVDVAPRPPPIEAQTPDDIRKKALAEGKDPPMIEECWEFDEEETAKILHGLSDVDKVRMPEELRSEKKFKEIFKPDGWEGLDDETILSELEDNRVRPVLDKIANNPSNTGWGNWGNWGVGSLISSATAGVSTLTSHITHGLTLLDEAMGAPDPEEIANDCSTDNTDASLISSAAAGVSTLTSHVARGLTLSDEAMGAPDPEEIANDCSTDNTDATDVDKSNSIREIQPQVSFGFNHLLYGVSSITKLVESSGTKVIAGGLETLETIGKKTMEVLQEGDPGLKKKRAFFLYGNDKPMLSQLVREAKEEAEMEEKTLEEKQLSRKVNFESLFDDYQGLVHLEALEMLTKQCSMKIQQRLDTLDTNELTSIRETLEEVEQFCHLGDEDDKNFEEDADENNLHERLAAAYEDLGVSITYEKLHDIWKDAKEYISQISSEESVVTEREVFQRAISTLARFTAFSVERFHKTAELLLIKEHRSTINEADGLVRLTRILAGHIVITAELFSNWLDERFESAINSDNEDEIDTVSIGAEVAISYIKDAFRLLIPILQVGAI